MHFHYHTLCHLQQFLDDQLSGESVEACLSQNKNELVLEFASLSLRIGCFTPLNYVVPIRQFARAKKNVIDLFPELLGKKYTASRVVPFERVLILAFEEEWELVLVLHSASANILLRHQGVVKDLFIQQREQDGDFEETPGQFLEEFIDEHEPIEEESDVLAVLRKISPIYEKTFAKRLWHDIVAGDSFAEGFRKLSQEVHIPAFYIAREAQRIRFYLFDPKATGGVARIEGIGAALDFFLRMHFTYTHYRQVYQRLARELRRPVKKYKKVLKGYQENIRQIEEGRDPEELGHLLMANLHSLRTGLASVELDDFYSGEKVHIKLKPELSPQENAARFYDKAKQAKAKLKYLRGELDDIERKYLHAEKELAAFQRLVPAEKLHFSDEGFDYDEIKKLRLLSRLYHKEQDKEVDRKYPFRTFQRDGYQIFVGKNAKNNDLLSFKFANKEDLWLHAKEVPGSHVIIRNKAGQNVPYPILEYAAQLAAFYSKRKNDSLVPVAYTPRKYVRKRRGDPPGMVALIREEVILVEPSRQ